VGFCCTCHRGSVGPEAGGPCQRLRRPFRELLEVLCASAPADGGSLAAVGRGAGTRHDPTRLGAAPASRGRSLRAPCQTLSESSAHAYRATRPRLLLPLGRAVVGGPTSRAAQRAVPNLHPPLITPRLQVGKHVGDLQAALPLRGVCREWAEAVTLGAEEAELDIIPDAGAADADAARRDLFFRRCPFVRSLTYHVAPGVTLAKVRAPRLAAPLGLSPALGRAASGSFRKARAATASALRRPAGDAPLACPALPLRGGPAARPHSTGWPHLTLIRPRNTPPLHPHPRPRPPPV
jgi:hypothetical protein